MKENIYSSTELYEQLKQQLALESSNAYVQQNLLKLLINDIGDSALIDLFYDYLPTEQIAESDSRYPIYLELQDKNCKSLRSIVKRLEKISKLIKEYKDQNTLSVEERLEKLLDLRLKGYDQVVNLFQRYGLSLQNKKGQLIDMDDLIVQIKENENYEKIIHKLLTVYQKIVNERIKESL